ncbi:MAG: lysylphosphatidylglycerol synthase transmembrane domain-containing protein, partial [Actinomycetota bacterium]
MKTEAERRTGNPLSFLIRIIIGVVVLGYVALRHPAELFHTIGNARPGWLLLAAAFLFAGVGVSALRWRAYLDALEISLPLRTLLRLYFVGTFFNAFLPTGIGGDAYKAVRIGKSGRSGALAFSSVFLDRFAGIVALGVMGFAGILIALAQGVHHSRVLILAAVLSAGIVLGAAVLLLFGDKLIARFVPDRSWGSSIRRAMRGIHEAGRHPGASARGYAYGLAFDLLVLAEHVALARALGIGSVAIAVMAAIVVIAFMATLLPTPNGLGFREAAY